MSAHEDSLVFSKSVALIEKTRRRVAQIDGANFPTISSEEARELLLKALETLADKTLWPAISPEALYNTLIHIQALVEEVEASTSDHISWPLVSYCDHIWKLLFPDGNFRIFYSLTAAHNYTISSFTDRLANRLRHVLPSGQVDAILGEKTLYCLQLASLEDENLPLYANIGHEFGHVLFLAQENVLLSLLDIECRPALEGIFKHLQTTDPLLAVKRTERTIWIIKALATELFCDFIGALISGPAFLLSLQEMGWGTNQDIWSATLVPKNEAIRAYGLEIRGVHLLLHDVPYVNGNKEIKHGTLVSTLTLAKPEQAGKPDNHVIFFAGELPCNYDGTPIQGLILGSQVQTLDPARGIVVNHSFSNKPANGFTDYYEKIMSYIRVLSSQAKAIDDKVTAITFKVIEFADPDYPFNYFDTNSSRAEIVAVANKLEAQKIAIIGLGGTGSYVLDFVAKTPVKEIHLFDGDTLENGVIYVSMEYATAIHKCYCGCGGEVVTPFSPSDWELTFDGKSISLSPSIGNWSFKCQSHYWIRNNEIEWAPKWGKKKIELGRKRDRREKKKILEGQPEKSFFKRLFDKQKEQI